MQVKRTNLSDTRVKLNLIADQAQLDAAKKQSLRAIAKELRLPGFRKGKIPAALVEKNANPNVLQQDFLERAMNLMYGQALDDERLRPVAQPQVTVSKFVPFTTLEIEAEVEVIGAVKLGDYKKLKLDREKVEVEEAEIDNVITQLQTRQAERKAVDREAKDGDQVIIDFAGTDAETKEPVGGADGKNYPLVIGSNTFIPGFEPNLVGMKTGDSKTFEVTFPDDYGVTALQGRKVSFDVTVNTVQEVAKPEVNDEFAAQVGPFKKVQELREDIKKQLAAEKQHQADRNYEEQILNKVADDSDVAIPDSLIDAEVARMEAEERQSLGYRGQTWQEHLKAEGVTEEEHRERNKDQAARRVKAGLVLADIAEKEKIDVSREELDVRLQLLRGQYNDKAMQAEINKPENRREIASRLLTEKTIAKLVEYAEAKK